MSFNTLLLLGLCFGVGFGFLAQRVGLCFAHGLGEIFFGRGKRFIKIFLTIFFITSIGFLLSGYIHPDLGLKTIGELRGFGFYNVLAGVIFGVGIFINGGCVIGTLRQIGEGSLLHLISILSLIPGMAFVVYVLNPILEKAYQVNYLLLPQVTGISAPYITGTLAMLSVLLLFRVLKR